MTTALPYRFSCVTLAVLALGGCATAPPTWEAIAARNPAPVVTASRETDAVATANADAADDPAIWRNAADPARSLIVGTDKKAGLNVYDFTGKQRSFVDAGRVNNVDLIDAGAAGVIVAASDRNDVLAAKIALFRLDTAAATLIPLGTVDAGAGEGYGLCLTARDRGIDAFMVLKDGTINQIALDVSGAKPAGRIVRTMKLATQSEGCVVDSATQRLYVAEENVGIWRFDARADGPTAATLVAKVDGRTLVADIEGITIASRGGGGWLIASSQGDNAYSVYDLATDAYLGRFRIGAGTLGATSETDGIEVAIGDFGPDFPAGVMIAQDGDNLPKAQNFKLVDWRQVEAALTR